MGNGFVLGGAAKGIAQGIDATRGTAQLQQQGELARGDLALQGRRQDFREQQAQQADARAVKQQAAKGLSDALNFTSDLINRAKLAGHTPEEIRAAIEPTVALAESAAQANGIDTAPLRARLEALITAPPVDEKGAAVAGATQPAAAPQAGQLGQVELLAQGAGVKLPPPVNFLDQSATFQRRFNDLRDETVAKERLLTDVQTFGDLLQGIQTGAISELTLPARQFLTEAGFINDPSVPAQEAIKSVQNQLALFFRNPASGFGLPGSTSRFEVEFLKDIPGGIQNTPEGNRAANIVLGAKVRRDAGLSRLREELFIRGRPDLFNTLKDDFIRQNPLFTPEEEEFLSSLKTRGTQTRTGQGAAPRIVDFNSITD